mgnify:CR=1 FL=1
MSIASDIIREHTDTIILSALLLRDSYGYEINKKIKSASGGRYELNEATLYTAFKRQRRRRLYKLLLGCRGHGCPQKILPHNPHRHR